MSVISLLLLLSIVLPALLILAVVAMAWRDQTIITRELGPQ